jgi:beta-glucosidase
MIKKNIFLPIALGLALLPTTSNSFALPESLHNASISARKKATFAKMITAALWKHAQGNSTEHIAVEQKLAQLYSIECTPDQAAQNLMTAIQNNQTVANFNQFYLGASSSAYQIEGGLDDSSAAARFYKNKAHLPTAGDAIDFYHRYPEIIKQIEDELNINAMRISFAWDRIQPQQGVFNQDAIKFYRNVIRTFLAYGIKPLVVFHHYDVPTWFEDLGGFEKAENSILFKQFCVKVYTELAEELGECLISMCCAPEGPAFKGYYTGEGTPGEKNNLQKTHTVIANMYYELVETALEIQQVYTQLQQTNPKLKKPFIGTQINVLFLDPHARSQTTVASRLKTTLGCAMGSYIQSGGTFNFLVNGHYCMYTPNADCFKVAKDINVYRYHPQAYKAFDWIGVNIYSNRFMNGFEQIPNDKLIEEDAERYTDNPNYRNYPEGIYRAAQLIAEQVAIPLGKLKNKNGQSLPVIVTENGIATKDDAKRTRYYQRAITTITALINDGYPVIGYFPWTSHDNFEWPTQDKPDAFDAKCYGFFAVNFDKNSPEYLSATLKEGSRYYANIAKTFFSLT